MEDAAERAGLLGAPRGVTPGESDEGELRHVGADVPRVALAVLAGPDEPDADWLHARVSAPGAHPASDAASRGSRLRSRRPVSPAASHRSRYSSSAPVNHRRANALPRASAFGSRDPPARRISGSRNS